MYFQNFDTISIGDFMRKNIWLIIIFIMIIIFCFIFHILKNDEIIFDNSSFTTVEDMKVEIYDDIKVSSKIKNINGIILEDKKIETDTLGKKTIEFLYKNKKGKKRKGNIEIEVVDTIPPIIVLNDNYTVTVGYDKSLTDVILSADNYDSVPVREIIGDYNLNQVGSYTLTYKVTDNSGNANSKEFTLHVKEKSNTIYNNTYTNFSDVVNTHKTDKTKIGIDVSKWQGEIDFEAIKNAGVEFIIIRVGTGFGFHESSIEDPYFRKNIEGAKKVGIPVGVYYYSYATTKKEASEQAAWVIDKLKNYKIDLPIAFDWESWTYFNELNISIHEINEIADVFLDEIEENGYKGTLYGSRNYFQKIWKTSYPVWLAHYTDKTNYEGSYNMWQLCENGKVDGIYGAVDINIMYE